MTANRIATWATLTLVLSPIFISLNHHDVMLLRLFQPDRPVELENAISLFSIFLALIAIPFIPAYLKRLLRGDLLFVLPTICCAYFTLIAGVSAVRTHDFYPLLGAIQYCFPVLSIPIGFLLGDKYRINIVGVLMVLIVTNIVIPAAVFAYLYFGGLGLFPAMAAANRYVYSLFTQIPAIVLFAAALLIGFASKDRFKQAAIVAVAVCCLIFFITWSRAAVIAAGLTFFIAAGGIAWAYYARPTERTALARSMIAVCVVLVIASLVVPMVGIIGQRSERTAEKPVETPEWSGEPYLIASNSPVIPVKSEEKPNWLEVSDASRMAYMKEGIRRWLKQPVFGIAFTPDEKSIIHREVVDKKQIFQSHNQYIDVLLKTGIVGFILLAGFYFWYVLRPLAVASFSRSMSVEDSKPYIFVLAVTIAAVICSNFQLYLTIWTTALPLGTIIGLTLARLNKIEKL